MSEVRRRPQPHPRFAVAVPSAYGRTHHLAGEAPSICLRRIGPRGDETYHALGPRTAGGVPAHGTTRICIEETTCP